MSFIVYNDGITSCCRLPGGITFYQAADNTDFNGNVQNITALNFARFMQTGAGILKMYRVAQNKIPHQTISNIFTTSGQILKILEAV